MVACNQEAYDENENGTSMGQASLIINIKSSNLELSSRGIEDLNDDGTISDQELFVDGQKMYRLAVYLIESGTTVKSSTVLEFDDQRFMNGNTEATVSFDNLEYHKSYQVYAIANYGNYNGITGGFSGVTSNNITQTHKVNAGTGNVCSSATPYPLTLKKEIQLEPGLNYVSGELIRTYARLRINVSNQSALKDMNITNLSFPAKFVQTSADLFTPGGTANATPTVTSTNTIVPFQNNLVIPKIDNDGNVTNTTIFDSYLLESNGGEYKYTLALNYGGEIKEVYKVSNTAITNPNDIESGGMYVIYNSSSGRYLYATTSNSSTIVQAGSSYLTNNELNHNYVWKLTKVSANNNQFTIESMGASGYYMQSSKISSSSVPMTVNPGNKDYFTISRQGGWNNYYLYLQSTAKSNNGNNSSNYYLSATNNSVIGSTNSNLNFYLYKVEKNTEESSIAHQETIPIRIVDKQTGEAKQITQINRNDFINIQVNVSYNEKSGNVTFEVDDWDEVNGEVTFD